ncbi:MAG: hypothetical protein SFT81_03285 [Candidatus Caenarcaniphilales bacterium]|nr:hypothetical protein [Candidatus Caenarcaniphilales bacterium]
MNETLQGIELRNLIRRGLYEIADIHAYKPDIDQIIEFFHQELNLEKDRLKSFREEVLTLYAEPELLRSCFYSGVIEFFRSLPARLLPNKKSLSICSWTQGNLFLQARKAEFFHQELPPDLSANPSIYASLDKLALLPVVVRDLKVQGCERLILIDDRLNNVSKAKEALQEDSEGMIFIHKIRPDKVPDMRISDHKDDFFEITEWEKLAKVLENSPANKIGIILDKDGVIYDTTLYRTKLEERLFDFFKKAFVR